MCTFNTSELRAILDNHLVWRRGEETGKRADLSHADLSGADLSGADLYRADLSHADLSGANLSGANLSGTDLSGANLYRADLSRADLYQANLYHANLSGADLYRADLSHADLSGANLYHANLSGADLYHANLSDARRAEGTIDGTFGILVFSGAYFRWGYVDKTTGSLRVEAGCRRFTLVEARAYWAGKDDRREVLAALDYFESVMRIRGWTPPASR
jgi:uncharacterized protein YjbI with pentapeptide repeats